MNGPLDLIGVGMRVTDLEFSTEKLRGAVISDAVRLNAHAEDITELTRRMEALFNDSGLYAKHIGELVRRIETLEQEHTKLSRHLGEMADLWNSADVSLARRIEKLEERTLTMTDLFMEGDLALCKRLKELEGGVSLLETICDLREQRLVSATQEHTKLAEELDEAALELARHIRRLNERVEKLEEREK